MELNTQQILNAQFYTLPLAVQDIINENEWKILIKKLATDYRLHQDQADIVQSIALLTMLGFADTGQFSRNIAEEAKIDSGIANEIGKRMNLEVFDILEQTALLVAAEQEEDLSDDSLLILDDARSQTDEKDLDELDLTKDEDLSAKKLLDEIENPENYVPKNAPDRAETHLQDHVDGVLGPNNPQETSSPQETKKVELSPAPETTTRPATHMRTLKSDIVKAKLQNPSWEPQSTSKTNEDLAAITKEAVSSATQSQNTPSDAYREQV